MRFLIRCAFWLSLALLFIPLGTHGHAPDVEPVTPLETLGAAGEAVRDVARLCERQPQVCAVASAAMRTIATRVREGLRLAEQLSGGEESPQAEPQEAPTPEEPVVGTSAPQD
ncbi:DUF5330 domain-containing protein [Chelativorans sp. M5D2P16]|uniref:DUF5330 domain-containing protein n=1 Tax=Chelativorans sp. M5D2P16 TaxID=3095678 RepID=UPI002ACAFCFE|nr:DUF5330 domain-containing protein [Chelativorans sp. M5D2P16]MDZ5698370.1 DUF5330 domain-containing protein [Chelativorans sp. M5D2P16]